MENCSYKDAPLALERGIGGAGDPKRIMLLTTARSYRNQAFADAAARLDVDVIYVQDMAGQLATHWNYRQGVDFSRPDAAAQAIADLAAEIANAEMNNAAPIQAIRAVDESGTLVAAKACALLGLPYNSPQAAEAARDKHLMRTLFVQAGVPCPRFMLFHTGDEPHVVARQVAQQVTYPCVVKPINLSGSRGVMRADDEAEFVAAVQRLTQMLHELRIDDAPQPYQVESFIPGFEVALEGILDHGKLQVLALFDKPDPLDGPFFEETIYVTPSRLAAETQAQIAQCAADSAAALGLRQGPIHAELRVNAQGPWILEVAGRSIGGLCAKTLRFDDDVSLEELILRQACGLPLGFMQREASARGVMMIPIPEAGVLRTVQGLAEAQNVPDIEEIEITAKPNYSLTPLPEGDSYLGFIFARGQTPEHVETALRLAHSKLHFEIVPELALVLG
ncbi:MAG: ATP-grasp domain-containing protein [Caldilineaceae bacterium]|nr:ATP-grasp domain-containing protein [Caldilineaceae bacterium]